MVSTGNFGAMPTSGHYQWNYHWATCHMHLRKLQFYSFMVKENEAIENHCCKRKCQDFIYGLSVITNLCHRRSKLTCNLICAWCSIANCHAFTQYVDDYWSGSRTTIRQSDCRVRVTVNSSCRGLGYSGLHESCIANRSIRMCASLENQWWSVR